MHIDNLNFFVDEPIRMSPWKNTHNHNLSFLFISNKFLHSTVIISDINKQLANQHDKRLINYYIHDYHDY